RRDEEGGSDLMSFQYAQNAGNALAIAVLALREPADRLARLAQFVGLMVGVERERHRAARAALPFPRPQRPSGAHAVDDRPPLLLRPLPRLLFHFFIFFANSLINADSRATNFANSAGGMPTPSSPCASNCALISGSASAFRVSAWMRAT